MNLLILPSESQVMSTSVRVVLRRFVEPVDRRDGEKLAQRPVIEQRLEDGEIAEELVAERILQVVDFVRHRLRADVKAHHALGDLPEKRLDLRLGGEVEQAEIEARLRVVLDLHRVVEMFAPVLPVERRAQFEQVGHRLGRLAALGRRRTAWPWSSRSRRRYRR